MEMFTRSAIWTLLALVLAMGTLAAAFAQGHDATPAPLPLPAGVTACRFDAIAEDSDGAGLTLRDAPREDARVLARVPTYEDKDRTFTANGKERPQFQVIGFKEGWLLIEGAIYPLDAIMPTLNSGRGWVEGKRITTHLFRDTLKTAPSNAAPDVVYLHGADKEGIPYTPYGFEVQIVGCSGPWIEVELSLPEGRTAFDKPVAPPGGAIRGWTDRSCPEQQDGPCRGAQFDYPWSPLPAGVTECNFGALSGDSDPKGLDVRDAPDANARVLGHIPPPTKIPGGDDVVAAEVQVIGSRNGWFLVEAGPYPNMDLPPRWRGAYTGRGWVAGDKLTTELLRNMLKQRPSEKSLDVVNLEVDDDSGNVSNPQSVKMRRILACSGDWVHVEIALTKGMKPLRNADAPRGAVRGWSNGTCTEQLTTCDFNGDTPWSPPAPLPPE